MAVSLTLVQVCGTSGALYTVVSTISAAVDIPAEVFVFSTDTGEFDHVASAAELATVPDTDQAVALAAGHTYYRLAAVEQDWEVLQDAIEFAQVVPVRLQSLVTDYDAAETLFVGTTTETFTP